MPGEETAFISSVIPDMVAHRITVLRSPALPLDWLDLPLDLRTTARASGPGGQ